MYRNMKERYIGKYKYPQNSTMGVLIQANIIDVQLRVSRGQQSVKIQKRHKPCTHEMHIV